MSLATSIVHIRPWQLVLKRSFDLVVSSLALILLSPFILYVALRVKISSPGPVIYRQERLGANQRKFCIRKFRSMFEHAEPNGVPQLSMQNDTRFTAWGKTMRRWKLDEIPQLWNVLMGDMSIVGPRPERAFYALQILKHFPQYGQLLQVRPGMTSYGMLRFGYAENIEQMIMRAEFDLQYLRNYSLAFDGRIIAATLRTIFKKRNR